MALKKGIWSGPILDNHFHLNPQGRYLDAARDFQRAGGTHLVLIHCPDFANPPTTYDEHFSSYSDTCDTAQKVRETSGLDVRVVLGPHPAAFAHQFEKWVGEKGDDGIEMAVENYWNSIDAAMCFIHENKAVALGEVGRPHWEVSEQIWKLSNELLKQTMSLSKKESIPLQLHVEAGVEEVYSSLASLADSVGLNRSRLIRHFAPPDISRENTMGITPSVNLRKSGLEKLMLQIESSDGFMLETDYMDDPRRPGAVLGPKTVPKRTQQLAELSIESNIIDEELFWNMHVEIPNSLYGV